MKNLTAVQERIEHSLEQFCAPILPLASLGSGMSSEEKNGTCALVDTGQMKIFVTCHHVWSHWKFLQREDPCAELWLGLADGVPLNLTGSELVDGDADIDLAVLRANVSPAYLRTKAFWQIETWPIQQAKVGDVVMITGYPGRLRESKGAGVIGWGSEFLGYAVSRVAERTITLAPDLNSITSCDENWRLIPPGNVGGMSGSPAYLLRPPESPILVGFLRAGGESDDFLFLTPASFLRRGGTLRGM